MVAILGWPDGSAMFAGFVFGYALYNDAHWCLHAGHWPRGRWFDDVAQRHALHHHGEPVNYNVLLPVGDWLFGTYRTPAR
jgi:sterol desaturase/sphingolipid hydroxylase (fatty acid hydroxylase superfamily)